MGNAGARAVGMEKAFIEIKDSVAGVVAQVCSLYSFAKKVRY